MSGEVVLEDAVAQLEGVQRLKEQQDKRGTAVRMLQKFETTTEEVGEDDVYEEFSSVSAGIEGDTFDKPDVSPAVVQAEEITARMVAETEMMPSGMKVGADEDVVSSSVTEEKDQSDSGEDEYEEIESLAESIEEAFSSGDENEKVLEAATYLDSSVVDKDSKMEVESEADAEQNNSVNESSHSGSRRLENTFFFQKLAKRDASRDYAIIVDRSASMKLKTRWAEVVN